ncbi:MAG: hypothetical protein ABJE95_35635 [Byssovorax sp.]
MNVAKRHIEGSTTIGGAAGGSPTRAIMIPLLPSQGAWVVTGVVQAVRADGQYGPVTFFPRITGTCSGGVAIANSTGPMPTEPVDGGLAQGFEPGGLSLAGAGAQGLQLEIELTGVASVVGAPGVAICWSWDLEVLLVATP